MHSIKMFFPFKDNAIKSFIFLIILNEHIIVNQLYSNRNNFKMNAYHNILKIKLYMRKENVSASFHFLILREYPQ